MAKMPGHQIRLQRCDLLFPSIQMCSWNGFELGDKRQSDEQEKAPACRMQVKAALDQGDFLLFGEGAELGINDADRSAHMGAKPFGPPENQTNQQPTRNESRCE